MAASISPEGELSILLLYIIILVYMYKLVHTFNVYILHDI